MFPIRGEGRVSEMKEEFRGAEGRISTEIINV